MSDEKKPDGWVAVEDRKPEVDHTVLLYSQEDHSCYVGWLNKLIEGPECFINETGRLDNISHWTRITPPQRVLDEEPSK